MQLLWTYKYYNKEKQFQNLSTFKLYILVYKRINELKKLYHGPCEKNAIVLHIQTQYL